MENEWLKVVELIAKLDELVYNALDQDYDGYLSDNNEFCQKALNSKEQQPYNEARNLLESYVKNKLYFSALNQAIDKNSTNV